jgi:hypothetical protein
MPISRATASSLMHVVEDCGRGLMACLPALQNELSPEEFRRMKRGIGRVIATMDQSVSAKVAAEYPDLAPEAVPIAHEP